LTTSSLAFSHCSDVIEPSHVRTCLIRNSTTIVFIITNSARFSSCIKTFDTFLIMIAFRTICNTICEQNSLFDFHEFIRLWFKFVRVNTVFSILWKICEHIHQVLFIVLAKYNHDWFVSRISVTV